MAASDLSDSAVLVGYVTDPFSFKYRKCNIKPIFSDDIHYVFICKNGFVSRDKTL